MWASFGGLGFSKIDAITQVTGVIINSSPPNSYSEIESILSQVYVSQYLNINYKALPSAR